MATSKPTCDLCLLLDITKDALFWCFSCNEYLCKDCDLKHRKRKATKEHKPITVDEYQNLPESVTSIKQECSDHDMKYDFYCKDHSVPCCLKCVSKNHKGCDDVQPLEEVIGNVKESFLIEDLQNRVDDISELLKKLLADFRTEKSKVNSESQRVLKEIDETRKLINQYLDILEAKLIENVRVEQKDLLNKLEKRACSFENMKSRTNQLGSDFSKIRKYASNFHTFCSINTMAEEIKQYEDQIDALQKNNIKSLDSITLTITPKLLRLMEDVDEFGSFEVHYRESAIYHFKKDQQGQTLVQNPNIKLNKILSFDITGTLTGCCVIETGEMIFCDNDNNRLIKTTSQGEFLRNFNLSFRPWDVKPVNNFYIAVTICTSKSGRKLVLVNVNSGTIEKTVFEGERCYGFCYKDDLFTVCTNRMKKILTIDMQGHVLCTINTDGLSDYCSVVNDKIYFTEYDTERVFCCDKNGKVVWKFDCEKGDQPLGIVADQFENVYVTCCEGNKCIWIDKSGSNSKILLTEKDGMDKPQTLFICKSSDSLLLCTENGSCLLYKLH